jgi:hypothetical protein
VNTSPIWNLNEVENMKQLMLTFAISILSVAALACGPAVGRAVGDAQVDVDATLAEMGEPTTEAEKELYGMMKEIDRLHGEEREDLIGALADSGQVINQLIMTLETLGDEMDPEALAKISSVAASGGDVDAFFQGLREQAYQASVRESEINELLANEEQATWNRIKFLNEQLDKANAEKAEIKGHLEKAEGDLETADKDENKWITSNLDKEHEKQMLEVRMERAAGKFEVVSALLTEVLGDEDTDEAKAPSDFEKSAEEAGRYQAAAIFNDCLVDGNIAVKEATREDMKHCRQGVLDELEQQGARSVEIVGGKVITKPNYMAMLDTDDVKEVVDAFMHCAQAADAKRIIGPAAEGCKMEAKEIHHDAAGSGDSFTDQVANRISGNNADARRTRKFLDVKAEGIGDGKFTENLEKVMYRKGGSKNEMRDALKGMIDDAKSDLDCDPQGTRTRRCDDIKLPAMDERAGAGQGRKVPIAHQYENRIRNDNRGGGGGQNQGGGGQNQGGGGQNQGLPPGITKAQFNEVFGGGEPRSVVKERVDQCVADGNRMNDCLSDVKNDMREEFRSHENFDQNKYSDRKELDALSTSAVRQNTRNPQGDDGHALNTNQFSGHGDGVGKRGGQDFNQCMSDTAGGGPKYNSDGTFVSSASHGDAADNCMGQASDKMRDSYGNPNKAHQAGMPKTQGGMTTQQ